jgi:hypothetical protein
LALTINKAYTLSYSKLRYYTSDAITSRCNVLNRLTCNYSTPNLKIVSGRLGDSLHCILDLLILSQVNVISKVVCDAWLRGSVTVSTKKPLVLKSY